MKKIYFLLLAMCLMGVGCKEDEPKEIEESQKTNTPVLIAQGKLHGGGLEGIPKQNLVIKTQTEWDNLKNAMNSVNNVTESFAEDNIDFSKYQVIAVFDEVKSNGGWSIDITNITEYADSIAVTIQNLKKGDATDVITQPFQIVRIPVSEKKIVFIKQQEAEKPIENSIIGKWKLVGIGSVDKIAMQELEPKDCKECYTLTFETDNTFQAFSSVNELQGIYKADYVTQTIQISDFGGTKINEIEDGNLYVNPFWEMSIQSFSLQGNELKLYYNESKNYLFFKSLKL